MKKTNTINELIKVIEEHKSTEALPYSIYKDLITLVRELQVEVG